MREKIIKTLCVLIAVFGISLAISLPVQAYDEDDLNQLLGTNVCEQCDLTGADLSEADLEDAILTGSDLTGADLSFAELSFAQMSETKLNSANLRGTDMHNAYLYMANFDSATDGANLSNASLVLANLTNVDWRGYSEEPATLSGADLGSATLDGSFFREVDFSNARLNGTSLISTYLANSNFQDADLTVTDFYRADLREANLKDADLTSADLTSAQLENANLTGAILEDAQLYQADLSEADLSDANLRSAAFREATLDKANLQRADLEDAYFEAASLEDANLSSASLLDALGMSSNLSYANLSSARLVETELYNADLRYADLREADVRGANFYEADLYNAFWVDGSLCTNSECTPQTDNLSRNVAAARKKTSRKNSKRPSKADRRSRSAATARKKTSRQPSQRSSNSRPRTFFAVVNSDGTLDRASEGVVRYTERFSRGYYLVNFYEDLLDCAYTATIASTEKSPGFVPPGGPTPASIIMPGAISVSRFVGATNALTVITTNLKGNLRDKPFHLVVQCPSQTPVAASSAGIGDETSIVLSTITALEPSNTFGHDEVFVKYSIDGGRDKRVPSSGNYEMAEGDVWPIDLDLTFKDSVRVSLYEQDPIGTDSLGSHTYRSGDPQPDEIVISGHDDSRYLLSTEPG